MSTTRGAPQGVVRMIDPPDEIRKKFKTAVTDSGTDVRYDPAEKPGISNLLEIMSVAGGEPISELEARYDSGGYGRFKEDVAEAVIELFTPIQQRYQELRADEAELRSLLAAAPRRPARPRPRRSSRCTSAWASSAPDKTIRRRSGNRPGPGPSGPVRVR